MMQIVLRDEPIFQFGHTLPLSLSPSAHDARIAVDACLFPRYAASLPITESKPLSRDDIRVYRLTTSVCTDSASRNLPHMLKSKCPMIQSQPRNFMPPLVLEPGLTMPPV